MRKIKYIMIHCTATEFEKIVDERDIARWWSSKGWTNPGYHFLIHQNGHILQLLDVKLIANGAIGYNTSSIHVAYVGGISHEKACDTRTKEQRSQLKFLITSLRHQFPSARIIGHNEVAKKTCPCFNVKKEFYEI